MLSRPRHLLFCRVRAMAILHKVRNCWCGEKHTHGEVMRLNSRDIPKAANPPRWGSKRRKVVKTKKKRKGEY